MQQRWWVVLVAVVGVGLAVLLFWPPSNGGKVEGGAHEGAVSFDGNIAGQGAAAVNPNAPRGAPPPIARPGANITAPGEAEQVAKRSRPESVYASKLVSPFSAIRYALARKDTPEAKALMEEIGTLMGDLRIMRQNPDAMTWAELQAKTDALIAKVEGSPWGTEETVQKGVERYRAFLAEYEVARSAPVPATTETPDAGEEEP